MAASFIETILFEIKLWTYSDLAKNRQWMKSFKARWKDRIEQLDLWLISYRIDIE